MKKKIVKLNKKRLIIASIITTIIFLSLCAIAVLVLYFYYGKIFPGIYISQTNVGGQTTTAAYYLIEKDFTPPQTIEIYTNSDLNNRYKLEFEEISLGYDLNSTLNSLYKVGRSGNLFADILTAFSLLSTPQQYDPQITYDSQKLDEYLSIIKSQQEVSAASPSAEIKQGSVIINPGTPGTSINSEKLKQQILHNFRKQDYSPILFATSVIDPTINKEQQNTWKEKITKLVGKKLIFLYDYQEYYLNDETLANILSPYGSYNESVLQKELESINIKFSRQPQNPVFVFQNNKVVEFSPAKPGVKINTDEVKKQIMENINKLMTDNSVNELVLNPSLDEAPPGFDTSEVNNLGINTLIGRGTSQFKGSISSRIYNIDLASSRINGHLIKPGEIFSFNDAVGDVSALTGYKQAYVIKDGKTVLGDGGGLCQVSTTMFRAALNAGLPVTERRAHSYRVYYYEQDAGPGLDATVYSPTTDLKIKNDTPGHILIQTTVDTASKILTFELYGTDDGREATITKPVILSSTKPPDDVYVDDPSLPTGQVNQIEHSAWGAKTVFDYTVTRNGEEVYNKKFYSVYQPWAAVYMRGIGPT